MPVNSNLLLLPGKIAEFAARLASGTIPAEHVLFDIRSGDDYIGLTELEVSGAGKSRLKSNQTQGRLLVWRTAEISGKRATALIKAFHDNEIWNLPSTRPGMPDERGIRVVLRYRSRAWARTFWLGEVSADRRWLSFHDEVQKIVDTLGRGRVLDWAN